MLVKGLTNGMAGCSLLLVSCATTPDRIQVGVTAREVRASHQGFKIKTAMPICDVRTVKRLTDGLEVYARGQFSQGKVEDRQNIFHEIKGEGRGNFESLGLGLDYFPFAKRWSGGEVGVEIYRADYDMRGWLGPLERATTDRFWGGGANLGLIGEIPLGKLDRDGRWRLVWRAGYNFTETAIEKARVDLDGWYSTLALVP